MKRSEESAGTKKSIEDYIIYYIIYRLPFHSNGISLCFWKNRAILVKMYIVYVSPQGVTRVRNFKILHIRAFKCVDKVMASWLMSHRYWHVYLVSMTTVLGGQDKSRQVTWQIQPSEVPHKVPEDDGVLVDNTRGGDGLVTLIHQQALQLLP